MTEKRGRPMLDPELGQRVKLNTRVPEKLAEAIAARAFRSGKTRSQVVIDILRAALLD